MYPPPRPSPAPRPRPAFAARLPVPPAALRALLPALLLGLLLVPVLGGCQKTQRGAAPAGEAMARSIATVNNEVIPYEDFLNQYQFFLTKWDRFIQNDPDKKQEIKELLLQSVIDGQLVEQEAHRKGIDVDDAELNRRALDLLAPPEQREGLGTEGILAPDTLADWSRHLRRRLVHQKLIQQEVLDKIRITPAEMRAYYDKHRDSFYRPERVKVRHIAVGSRSLYNRVMGLLQRNRDFGELVQQYSITPDRFSDGELGYVERGVLPEEFDKAIFKMTRVGSLTPANDPVQTEMGFHIFRLEGREPEGLLDFRQALPEIRRRLLDEKEKGAYQLWLENLRQKATIVIDEALLNAE